MTTPSPHLSGNEFFKIQRFGFLLPVNSSSVLTASYHFRREVGGSPTESTSQFVSKNLILAQTKVNHLDMAVSIQQKILQFEVPIYDPPFVQVPKCANNFGSIKP